MVSNVNIIGVGDAGLGAIFYLLENNIISSPPTLISSPAKLGERALAVDNQGET